MKTFFSTRLSRVLLLVIILSLLLAVAGCNGAYTKADDKNSGKVTAVATMTAVTSLPEGTSTPRSRSGPIAVAPEDPSAIPNGESQSYRLKIPVIGVDAPIAAVGLDKDGAIAEPNSPDLVVWYDQSALPGWQGNSVLSGHLDWKTSTAVFWRLRELKPGDNIYVHTSSNNRYRFIVQWAESYRSDNVPMAKVFADLQEPSLTIITCGGVFNRNSRDYSERLVVRAVGS